MKIFNKLERKYGRYAIRNLIYYIIIMYGIGIVLLRRSPEVYYEYLSLDAERILQGQVWRVFTFMIYPPSDDFFFNLLALYLYYSLGSVLERMWGAFRFNIYFFMGLIGHVLAVFVGYFVFHETWLLTTTFLNFSIFFAYAITFPNAQFYLMMMIPISAKVLAYIEGAVYLYYIIFGNARMRCEVILSMANVLIYFLITRDYDRISSMKRKFNFQNQSKIKPQGKTHHKCAVCGRTELDSDTLEFRYCSKCQGSYEYCSEHLYTHQHVSEMLEEKVKQE